MIEARQLNLLLGGRPVLTDVNATFRPGKRYAILGPNGAGKTSLLKVLSGEWSPFSGKVQFLDNPLTSWDPLNLAQHRAFLHQETVLEFAFSVYEVVMLGRAPFQRNGETPEDHEFVEEAIHKLDLAGMENRLFPSLSGGEKQRVHFARALTQVLGDDLSPKFMFLDEPTNNLDLSHQFKVLELAKELSEKGIGIVMILHDLNLAMRYAEEVLVLDQGKAVASGKTEETLLSPEIESVFDVHIQAISIPDIGHPVLDVTPRTPNVSSYSK